MCLRAVILFANWGFTFLRTRTIIVVSANTLTLFTFIGAAFCILQAALPYRPGGINQASISTEALVAIFTVITIAVLVTDAATVITITLAFACRAFVVVFASCIYQFQGC
jgi:hypothetical protein